MSLESTPPRRFESHFHLEASCRIFVCIVSVGITDLKGTSYADRSENRTQQEVRWDVDNAIVQYAFLQHCLEFSNVVDTFTACIKFTNIQNG